MVSFNRVVLAGNLTRDPELRFTQEGVPVANFSIAVNRIRSKSEAVDFFNVSCWRELGERVANYKKKGDPIVVEGHLQHRTWQTPDGTKRSAVEVVANNVQFLNRSGDPQQQAEAPASVNEARGETAGAGGVWQPSSRPQVARREWRNSRRRKISRTSRFKERALAVAFVESPILLKLGRRALASTNSPRPLSLGEEFSDAQRALQSYQRNHCRR
jgi:single-strand DNA-binding protein